MISGRGYGGEAPKNGPIHTGVIVSITAVEGHLWQWSSGQEDFWAAQATGWVFKSTVILRPRSKSALQKLHRYILITALGRSWRQLNPVGCGYWAASEPLLKRSAVAFRKRMAQ